MAANSRPTAERAGDREKALETALLQIERQFGKGSVMRLGEETRMPVEVIPTGSIALDVALGLGGLPRGRIVEIYGPESSGKCLTADTFVWSDRGLETIAEIFERAGLEVRCASRVTDISESGIRLVNEMGELETVVALTHNNRQPVRRLKLRSGRAVSVTDNHPLRVASDRGFIMWRRAKDIRAGDTVVSAGFGAVEAAGGDGLSEDEAVLLGYLVAEGSPGCGSEHPARFATGDPEVTGEFARLMADIAGIPARRHGSEEPIAQGKDARERSAAERSAAGYGPDYARAAGREVPACIRTAGHKVQRAFLSALFEGGGWIGPSAAIGLGTASEELARQVQLMLYGLGIPAAVSSKYDEKRERESWSVTVNPAEAGRFLAEVGFRSARRKSQAGKCLATSPRNCQLDRISHLSGPLSDPRDDRCGARESDRGTGGFRSRLPYLYEEVVAVEDGGLQPTFDVVLPRTHSFVANGVLSHNTTVALHAVANAQKAGGIAAFIDAEHALDPGYAKNLGVDTDALLVSQPDTGEQALEIADMLIRSGAIDIVVIDSVAALVPKAEIEGEMGDSHVGLQARLMSQALRKITGALSQTKTTAIFINQLREKVGVLFGCMDYGTRVTLADGSQEKIGKIVSQRMDVEVLSYDPETDTTIPRRIVNWFDNGKAEKFLQFSVAKSGGNGPAQFAATENHLIRTPGGWRQAGELRPGDRVLAAEQRRLSGQQLQLILGSLMGDGSLSPDREGRPGTRFRLGHGARQAAYLDWKASLLGNIAHVRAVNAKGAVSADFTPLPELDELHEAVYFGDGTKHLSWDYLKNLAPLALAVWYMDDGSFAPRSKGAAERIAGGTGRIEIRVGAMSPGSRDRLTRYLRDTYALDVSLRRAGARKQDVLQFSGPAAEKFQELIAPYVHPSMEYKLLPQFRGQFSVEPEFSPATLRLIPARVLDICVKPPARSMNRFDIEIEGSHNYFVDGVMVHNSPETTTGGKALKFYSSVRLDVRRIETLKDGTDAVGNRTKVKVVKNKLSPPFKVAEFDILYGIGISREGSLIDLGVEHGIVRKSGAWYTYDGDQLGQGKENARNFLRDNPDLANEIEKRIKEKLGVGPRIDADADASAAPPGGGPGPARRGPAPAGPGASRPVTAVPGSSV